mgnify:CR=1 FL=1|tara:strand:+ start:14134 stop:15357 length:1224 start_codon:yes stop_codon:yes gene_type:complete
MNLNKKTGLFNETRQRSIKIIENLSPEDMNIQSMEDASPLKWHLAHTTWFFEHFVVSNFKKNFKPFNEKYNYLFNSYYVQSGPRYKRSQRSLISKPNIDEVLEFRKKVDIEINDLINSNNSVAKIVELGCHHEMQHQELMLTDLLHGLSFNPLLPVYNKQSLETENTIKEQKWVDFEGGIKKIGALEKKFSFDCEKPRHDTLIHPFRLSNKLVTNGEWIEFINDNGYSKAPLWMIDGFTICQNEKWIAPLYWWNENEEWFHYTLNGPKKIDLNAPVNHISFYEADAYARWKSKRLPTEFEWEISSSSNISGNFLEKEKFVPESVNTNENISQMWGDVWEWTSSSFLPYPGFKIKEGPLGEYNGKFMSNQIVLKGGSCFTPENQIRKSYRNFFYPHQRWQMSGLRLAE